jgi:hypothetical protein
MYFKSFKYLPHELDVQPLGFNGDMKSLFHFFIVYIIWFKLKHDLFRACIRA